MYCNPRHDLAFRARVERLLDEVESPHDLQERLRIDHPLAIVRARELSAEALAVWYAYRDGRWVPGDGTRERMSERADGVRPTAEQLAAAAERLQAIEASKAAMPDDHARVVALPEEAVELTETMAETARVQSAVVKDLKPA